MKSFFRNITTAIIQYEAKLVLRKYKPKIVVVVGSVGKTTTKDAVYSVLSKSHFARKSEKSFNSEIGIPLTILGLKNAWSNPFLWVKNFFDGLILVILNNKYPEWLVLEVGADHPGDIKRVTKWIKSDVIILTRLPDVPVHVEYFESPEEVTEEKLSIIESLKEGGTIVLNGDDEKLSKLIEVHQDKEIAMYGFGKKNDVSASHYNIYTHNKAPKGIRFHLSNKEDVAPIEVVGALGKQNVYPVLAASAVGVSLGIDLKKIVKSLEEYKSPNGRMKIIEGLKNTTIIDDSYNSSPTAVYAALDVVEKVKPSGKKIVVLGDMMELGKYSIEQHKKIGNRVSEVADMLVTVGFRARSIADGALSMGMHASKVLQNDDIHRAGKELEFKIDKGDVILIKGSQSIRAEIAVEEIMLHPENKAELLVRQDKGWRKR